MLFDDPWWEEFWQSPEGQAVKDAGRLEEADGERILELVQKRYKKSLSFTTPWFDSGQFKETEIPECILKAFEED